MVGEGLTVAQRRFAEQHHAAPGAPAGCHADLVFLYTEDHLGTTRWLVDADGCVVEQMTFRSYATGITERRFDADSLLLAAA